VKLNPRDTLVNKGIELCRKEKVDSVFAVGGGSVLDLAKGLAMSAKYDSDFLDFYSGKNLRTPAAGSRAHNSHCWKRAFNSTLTTNEGGMLKRFADRDLLRPKFTILKPELTITLPPFQMACGVKDIMTHVINGILPIP
jgi:alcohol dehydrogenase